MPRVKASVRRRQGRRRLDRAQQQEEVGEEPAQRLPQKNAGEEEEAATEELSRGHDEVEEKETEGEEEEEKIDSDGGHLLLTDYEKQREHRIKENAAKLAALKLPTLASSFWSSPSLGRPQKGSRKRKGKEDEDYMPNDSGSNSDTDDSNNNEEASYPGIQQDANADDDEDRALQQALALSLETSVDDITGVRSRVSQTRKNKRHVSNKNDKTKKRKKGQQEQQFTNDDIAAIFSLIDEQGKGKFSATDLNRVARLHDFTWSKQEISDMIDIFDHNKDGQLDLLEFQDVFGRTGMLKTPEPATGG